MLPEFHGLVRRVPGAEGDRSLVVEILFPKAAAPDENAAMGALIEAFPDHEPTHVSEAEDRWVFALRWASGPHESVDPGVPAAAETLYGLGPQEIGGYREVHGGGRDFVFSMIHAWALLAPSLAIQRRGGAPLPWVVHVDDHTDMMPPMVEPLARPGMLRDQIFGEEIDIADPASVVAAIRRGVVSKGNFLTAYLLAYPGCRTVYVGRNLPEQDHVLSRRESAIQVGGRSVRRTDLARGPVSGTGAWDLRESSALPHDLPMEQQDGVWLDLDLDYFCNRYNGDSDRHADAAAPDERAEVMGRVERFLTELAGVRWLSNIQAVSIAVSPGFFPADHWADVISAVREGIRRLVEG